MPFLLAAMLLAAEPLSEKQIARIVDESEANRARALRFAEQDVETARGEVAAAKRGKIDSRITSPWERRGNGYAFRSRIAKQDQVEWWEGKLTEWTAKRDALKKGDKLCLDPICSWTNNAKPGKLWRLEVGELVRATSPTSVVWRVEDGPGRWRTFKLTGLADLDKTKPEELKLEGLVFRSVSDDTLELVDVSAIEKDLPKLRKRR